MERATTRPIGRGEAGFTLVEILAVLAILSLLMSLAVFSFSKYQERGRSTKTISTISSLSMLITSYQTKKGAPPPDSLQKLKIRAPNEMNEGAEALYAALHSKDYPEGANVDEDVLGNSDEDETPSAYHRDGVTRLLEVKDGWGNPIAYITPPNYGRTFGYSLPEPDDPADTDQQVTASKSGVTGVWANPDSYQLISAGSDKKFGTDDDITNFTK
jgi:prepilin-type N-terminal cleavage/methylation domain-containing protein